MFFILGKQTTDRLKEYIERVQESNPTFLQEIQEEISASRVEDHVIRNITTQKNKVDKKSEENKIKELRKRIELEKDETVFCHCT